MADFEPTGADILFAQTSDGYSRVYEWPDGATNSEDAIQIVGEHARATWPTKVETPFVAIRPTWIVKVST